MRNFLVILAALAAVSVADGQPARPAAPIGRESLERLNLRADWNAYIPVAGKKDGIVLIQPVDDQQVYVETKGGLLVALDARTGRQQWSYKFPNSFSGNEQVAVNAEYCFAVGIGKLYCFDRFTGALMLEQDLRDVYPHREETPVSGPVADALHVYIQMASGTLVCYKLPDHLRRKEAAGASADKKGKAGDSSAEKDARNYGTNKMPSSSAADDGEYRVRTVQADRGAGIERDVGTPSISALYSVVPPYVLNRDRPVQSVSAIPTLTQPNRLIPDHQKYNQQSPSVSSQSALYRLNEDSSLRAVGDKFKRQWRFLMPDRAFGAPVLLEYGVKPNTTELWLSTVGKALVDVPFPWVDVDMLVRNEMKVRQMPLGGLPLHPMVGPFGLGQTRSVGYIPLDNGKLKCLTLFDTSSLAASADPRQVQQNWDNWEAPVGGQMTNAPIVGADAVYASGPRSGVVKVESKTGDVKWRTAAEVDQVLAVNREHLYARDNRGRLFVYPTNGRPDPRTQLLRAAATLDVPEFTVGVSNDKTDRILLGGENGLVVCLRDAAAAYARPIRIAPPPIRPTPPAAKPAEVPPMGEPKN